MSDEGDWQPRSTAEALAAIRAKVASNLHPQEFQPWNDSRPDGWPLHEAVFTFAHKSTRNQISTHLELAANLVADPRSRANLEESGWNWLRQRLSRGELHATGVLIGKETEPKDIPASLFDGAEMDPVTKEVLAVGQRYGAVRVFDRSRSGTQPQEAGCAAPNRPPVNGTPRTGPRPIVSQRVEAEMRAELAAGRLTRESLEAMKKIELPAHFSGKETTCMKVRRVVLGIAPNRN